MRYVISSKWLLGERFTITDQADEPRFEVHGHLGRHKRLSLQDESGHKLAEISEQPGVGFEIRVDEQHVASVRHDAAGGDHYRVDSSRGQLDAQGDFGGWNYTLSGRTGRIASITRHLTLREKFTVDIADEEDPVFTLAVVLAIDAVHHAHPYRERRGIGREFVGGGAPEF